MLYEREPLEFGDHTIKIKKTDSDSAKCVNLKCIYYILEQIPLLPVPISVSLLQMSDNINVNDGCDHVECKESISDYENKDSGVSTFDVYIDDELCDTVITSLNLASGVSAKKIVLYNYGDHKVKIQGHNYINPYKLVY